MNEENFKKLISLKPTQLREVLETMSTEELRCVAMTIARELKNI